MANILITGGSGLLGRAISELFLQNGDTVRWLSRKTGNEGKIKTYKWDLDQHTIDEAAFKDIDTIIHLAGAGIVNKRWTDAYKKELLDSRVKSTELIWQYLSKHKIKLKSWVGGSAIGYYGSECSSHLFTENDEAGNDFLGRTCVTWEKSYAPFQENGIRTVVIRTGIVLSKEGGAYDKMKPAFQFGLGAVIGSGNQAFPWIHVHDLATIFVAAVKNETMNGVYNAVATEQTTNSEFSKALAKSLHRPLLLPKIPSALLHLVLRERAITLTGGVKVSNAKLKLTGFKFKFENLEEALNDLVQ